MNPLLLAAGVSGFVAVALGAFGAHGLTLSTEATGWWNTASHYFLIHSVAALFLSGQRRPIAGWAFIAGSVFFAGSLYAMALGGPRILGTVTPIGGLCYLVGWATIAFSGMRNINAADEESAQ